MSARVNSFITIRTKDCSNLGAICKATIPGMEEGQWAKAACFEGIRGTSPAFLYALSMVHY
jgi:hypothetical protein